MHGTWWIFFLFDDGPFAYIIIALIYVGGTLNIVVVFQFHNNVLHNPLHCLHIDDRLHSISRVSSTTNLNELVRNKNKQDRES